MNQKYLKYNFYYFFVISILSITGFICYSDFNNITNEDKKGIFLLNNRTIEVKDKSTNKDINEEKKLAESSNLLSTEPLLSEDKSEPSLSIKPAGRPGNLAGHSTGPTPGQTAPEDQESNTLVPNLASTLMNIKLGLEKDIDSFKILG